MPPRKVHTTSLCWVPAVDQQEPIQRLRVEHDRQIGRWPPHVNVLYPFVPIDEFEEAVTRLSHALAAIPAFDVAMRRLQRFTYGKKSLTAWLAPEPDAASPPDAWQTLQALCQRAFPHCTDQTDRCGAFVAHLTVGQFTQTGLVDQLQASLERSWQPLRCAVGSLVLISRAGQDQPFLVHWRVPLGGDAPQRAAPPLERGVWLPDEPTERGPDASAAERAPLAEVDAAADPLRVTVAANTDATMSLVVEVR